MGHARRIYLDNAATSFPKPPGVYEAMLRYGQQIGGTAGRGTYFEAAEGARLIRQCRRRLCTLINGEDPEHVIFTLNTTDALNLAIKGIAAARQRRGRSAHLITTVMDHNSVLRPFNRLAGEGCEWTCVDADPATGLVDPDDIRRAIHPHTALVAIVHASNVTGIIQPIAEIGAICREREIPFLVDAAQSLGHIPVDVRAMNIDLLAMPGHKGLLGPLGTGALYIRPGLESRLLPLREGGTGSRSEIETQPDTLPDKYEPGSQNAVGIVGLSEALAWIFQRGGAHFDHERSLIRLMLDQLLPLEDRGLRLLGPRHAPARVGVFSLIHDSLSAHELAILLEQRGILGRAGLHCAPRAHALLGTRDGGAFRLSVGPFLTADDIREARDALAEVCRAASGAARQPA
jgi:cysteine desulfurase / selenocysteine lyase